MVDLDLRIKVFMAYTHGEITQLELANMLALIDIGMSTIVKDYFQRRADECKQRS